MANNPEKRKLFATAVKRFLSDDFRYIIVTVEYDQSLRAYGDPYSVTINDIEELYGDVAQVTQIDTLPEDSAEYVSDQFELVGLSISLGVYLLQNKE